MAEDFDGVKAAVPVVGSPAAYVVNLTGGRIDVLGDGRAIVLAPLRRLPIDEEQLRSFDRAVLVDSDLVRLQHLGTPVAPTPAPLYGSLAVVAITILAISALSGRLALGLLGVAACAVLGLLLKVGWTWSSMSHGRPPTIRGATRWLGEKVSQLLVFVIGFGAALAAAVVANGGLEGARLSSDQQVLFRISLQTLFLGLAITFPAFLYFAFDRQRAAALRTRFLSDAFRLDDRLHTVGEIEAKYGARMKDAFGDAGSVLPSDERVRSGRRRSPVVVATLVLSLALVVAFVDVETEQRDGPLLALFTPTSAILPFAFLGAYLFAVLTAMRSYLRGDLLPKAYSQMAARMLVVVTLAAVLGALSQAIAPTDADTSYSPWLLALAFFAGLVPNTVLQFLSESTRRVFKLRGGSRIVDPQPLTMLQGIDLYDRARLEQEGVTTLAGLVYADLMDLMIQTRIPTARLVDWLDQAVLQIYVAGEQGETDDASDPEQPARAAWGAALRANGFRTASDLLMRSPSEPPLDSLVPLVRAEPAMRRVMSWKANDPVAPRLIDARSPGLPRADASSSPQVARPRQSAETVRLP
jgi:hypothetical protein